VTVDASLRSLVDTAVADLAGRLRIPPDEVAVVEARSVVWPDGSFGCPEPGMQYAQVLQEGVLIRLSAGGNTYSYHGGGSRKPFLCEHPAAPVS
jgi:hypothetical protein